MSIKLISIWFVGLSITLGGTALADEPSTDDLAVTITLMSAESEEPAAVTKTLELPKRLDEDGNEVDVASEQGVEHSAAGLDTANAARENGRRFGQTTAADAQESHENLGRGGRPNLEDLLPDRVPTTPGPPAPPVGP